MKHSKSQGHILLLLPVLLLLLSSCATTKMKASWGKPGYSGKPLQRILVLGLMNNGLDRQIYEDYFSDELLLDGVEVMVSHTFMPQFEDMQDKEKVRAIVAESGADAVLLALLVRVENKDRYVSPYSHRPYYGVGVGFYDYYGRGSNAMYRSGMHRTDPMFDPMYDPIYDPGYIEKNLVVNLETTVFLTANAEMVWSGATTTKKFTRDLAQAAIKENANLIRTSMKKFGLLP